MTAITVLTLVDSEEHLAETYESLRRQSCNDWKWLVVPLDRIELSTSFGEDPRVCVALLPSFVASQGLAACKEFGYQQAQSTHVFELDQHDFLADDVLEKVVAAIAATDADLLYTDFVNVPVSGEPAGYRPEYGWETYVVKRVGQHHRAIRAFDPSPSVLSQASYAPSHGLTWRRETFSAAGGPDPTAGYADAFDLVCRAYLGGARFHHVAGGVVFSRLHAYRSRDELLEGQIGERYVYEILREWSARQGLPMLDLGAAHNPTPGFVSVDLHDAEVNCDIRLGFPLDDSSVGCIRAWDFLEHMNHCPDSTCVHGTDGGPRCVVGVMNELYRVLTPGGWLVSRTPSTDGRGAFQDPTHTSFWNPNSFWYYTRREQANFVNGVECRFQAARIWQAYPSDWHEQHDILYVHADLVALKGQRQPGLCEI
jgi:SAM-dependent methyltransferase